MKAKADRLSPPRVARELGVHRNTVRAWARAALEGRPSKLIDVERNKLTGYITIGRRDVLRLKAAQL